MIKKFKELKELEMNGKIKLWVLSADDLEDDKETKIIFNGEEIQNKVIYLVCADELNQKGGENGKGKKSVKRN